MPCAAPCDRLPCNQRCIEDLSCGHRCPSLCGERCPEGYCQICSDKTDARVDLLEMKSFSEIDLNESPIVVLSCGHFFTAKTLDGMVGMTDVYEQDGYGNFTQLKDISCELALAIPRCPDCNTPIRQFVTKRYNRSINRAVNDEMSKRFIVSGENGLRELEAAIEDLGQDFEASRNRVLKSIRYVIDYCLVNLSIIRSPFLTRVLQSGRTAVLQSE